MIRREATALLALLALSSTPAMGEERPVGGVEIQVQMGASDTAPRTVGLGSPITAGDGEFMMGNLPAGEYVLTIEGDELRDSLRPIYPGSHDGMRLFVEVRTRTGVILSRSFDPADIPERMTIPLRVSPFVIPGETHFGRVYLSSETETDRML